MEVIVCSSCRKLFNYLAGERLCPDCRNSQEELFHKTKEYIRKNPNSLIGEVAKECEVSVELIHKWIRQERLILNSETITCQLCSKPIVSGRFCAACKNKIQQNLQSALPQQSTSVVATEKPKSSNRMRFLDK